MQTPLDTAHAAMVAGDEAAALAFYRLLADATLFLLLEREAEGERIQPRIFDLADGPVVLVFDTEERLAALGDTPLPYAALPGRIIAQHLAGQGISLGLNLGTAAASEVMLPPEALSFLTERLGAAPQELEAQVEAFVPPQGLPPALDDALRFTLSGAAGLARAAVLAGVRYQGGRRGHVLAILDAVPEAEEPLARAMSEALAFSGVDAAELDVTFLSSDAPAVPALVRAGLMFDVPLPEAPPEPLAPPPPGSDPLRPPRLR
ncbi:SseB family protein [Fuscibacter oryzae]|uniref:SseB family protein n=1 Tax=Fuscibacter oryzae TaxID=2803939 RepID=A0A8J7SUH1_9RHOB|nr:SseB family protein [Fuscibacter oryzae]MBL4927616.1 SseB family protein [Fuscibacter oryzae]